MDSEVNCWTDICDQSLSKLISSRSKHTMVAYNRALYVFGGVGDAISNRLFKFDFTKKEWVELRPTCNSFASSYYSEPYCAPPPPRYFHSAVVSGGSMYIFGGCLSGNVFCNDLFEYKFQIDEWVRWTYHGEVPGVRSAACVAVYDNKLWIYSGFNECEYLNDMWSLSLIRNNTKKWEKVNQKGELPTICDKPAVAVAEDCMYVLSGQSIYEFDFKTQTWRVIYQGNAFCGIGSLAPRNRCGHTMVYFNHDLYVFGGARNRSFDLIGKHSTFPKPIDSNLYCYDLRTNVWSIINHRSREPPARVFHASVVIDNAMYTFGGTKNQGRYVYRFKFSKYPKCTLRNDFGKFYNENKFCDIQFIVGVEEIKVMAHIAFVAARSKYLRTKILSARETCSQLVEEIFESSNMKRSKLQLNNTTNSILEMRFPDANPEAFKITLNYMYTDNIVLEKTNTENIAILLTDIHKLALLFEMSGLKNDCEQFLDLEFNKQNILETLVYAVQKGNEIVKDQCLQFIIADDNFKDVAMLDEFKNLEKVLLLEIMRGYADPCKDANNANKENITGATLESDMEDFIKTTGKDFSDINLRLKDEMIAAHKAILIARTEYFQSMYRSFVPADNTVEISIGNILPTVEAFKTLLYFIYYGEMDFNPTEALYLLEAPIFYGLSNSRLSALCEDILLKKIQVDNVLETLEAADYLNNFDIQDRLLDVIFNNLLQVVYLPKIQTLSCKLLLKILQGAAKINDQLLEDID